MVSEFFGKCKANILSAADFLGALENEYLGCGCGWRSLLEI
ncbi:hypothetical protein [Dapis sp. BLCC M229]